MLQMLSSLRSTLLRKKNLVNNMHVCNVLPSSSSRIFCSPSDAIDDAPPSTSRNMEQKQQTKYAPYLTAFTCFLREFRSKEAADENFDYSHHATYAWSRLTAEQKAVYEEKAKAFNEENSDAQIRHLGINVRRRASHLAGKANSKYASAYAIEKRKRRNLMEKRERWSSKKDKQKADAARLAIEYKMPVWPQTGFVEFFREFSKTYTGGGRPAVAAARAWKELPDVEKASYNNEYAEKRRAYHDQMKEWTERMLSDGHRDILLKLKVLEKDTGALKSNLTKLAAEYHKPQYPQAPYSRFYCEFITNYSGSEPAKAALAAWKELSADEKTRYTASFASNMKNYRKLMGEWSSKMLSGGNEDVLTKLTPVTRMNRPTLYGMPEQPASPYIRFSQEFAKTYTGGGSVSRAALSAWKAIPLKEKEPFYSEYMADCEEYCKGIVEWLKEMLRDGREDTLRDLIVQIPFNRSGAEESALAAKYELPPLPPTAFDRFRRDLSKMFAPGDGSDGKIIAATRVWKELPAAEQQKAIGEYKAAVKVFGEQMVVWMSGMISSGREDILKKLLKPVVARPTTTSVKKDTAVLNDIPSTPLDVPDQLHDDPSKKHSYDVILPKLNESLRTEKELDTLKMPTPPLSPSERYTREALEKKWINFSDHHVARRAWLRLPLLHKRKYMDAYEVDLQIYRNKMAEWGAEMEASGKEAILKAVNVFANPVGGRRKGQTNERTVHGCDLFIKDSLMHLAEDDSNAHGQFDSAISTDEMAKILLKWEELPAEKRLEYSAKATEAAAKGDIDEDAAALSLSLNIRHYMTRYKMLAIEYNMPEHPRMPFARYREEMMSDPATAHLTEKELQKNWQHLGDETRGMRWRRYKSNVPEFRQKYLDAYDNEMMKYKEELKNWEKKMQSVGLLPVVKQLKTITRSGRPELLFDSMQRTELYDNATIGRFRRMLRNEWKRCEKDAHDLALVSDMPQYPLRAFQLFMTDFLKTYSGAEPAKSVALREWKEMSFIKQEKYRRAAAADMQVYIKAMEEWKDRMMRSGHGDVLAKLSPMLSSLQTGETAIENAQTPTLFSMPERPRTEFWRFYDEFSRTYSGRQPTKIAAIIAWRTVSEEERERYSSAYQAELKVYSEKVNEWMEKMLSNENYSILKRYIGKPDVKNVAEEYFTRKYEIPQRPKLSPYLRFREDFKQTHSLSDDSKRDARLIARAWRNLPDESKAKYISSWNEEMQLYRESLIAWKEKMRSSEREDVLKQLEALRLFALKPMRPAAVRGERGQLESSTQQNRKSEAACLVVEYEMPKRPQHSAYLEFFHEFAKSYTGDESQAKAAGRAWKELTDAEKEKYNSKCSEKQQAYKEQMKEWMDKMISNGNEEILLKLKVASEPDLGE